MPRILDESPYVPDTAKNNYQYKYKWGAVEIKYLAIALSNAKIPLIHWNENYQGYVSTLDVFYKDHHLQTSAGGIHYYESIKIRSVYTKFSKVHGYPIHLGYSMDTFGGLMFWIPYLYRVWANMTMLRYSKDMDLIYREVVIRQTDKDLTQETISDSVDNIPLIGKTIDSILDSIRHVSSTKLMSIYENIAFYNTMHDAFIFLNWDKIKDQLSNWGY